MKTHLKTFVVVFCLSFSFMPCFAACPPSDLSGDCVVNFKDFALMADQWLMVYDSNDLAVMALEWLTEGIPEPDITWVYINDLGVTGYESFTGYVSKYETTNAQYCQFLNAALATGDITVIGNDVVGANGSNTGADFAGEYYYNLAGPGYTYNDATNGGAARINYTGNAFTFDAGFESHPVPYVSWYGATAFCNYYGWRLPTEWEWQAAADYDGSFIYGCGTNINTNIANYRDTVHLNGTTITGSFGAYGYGLCDTAGNVQEWTSSVQSVLSRHIRGGGWRNYDNACTVSFRGFVIPESMDYKIGFRVFRNF